MNRKEIEPQGYHLKLYPIYILTATITERWSFEAHMLKMGMSYNNICRSWKLEGNRKTVRHFLCESPALSQTGYGTLGIHQLSNLECLWTKSITKIISFLEGTKWFEHNDLAISRFKGSTRVYKNGASSADWGRTSCTPTYLPIHSINF